MNVKYETLKNGILVMNNSASEFRAYDISAFVNVSDKAVGNIDGGIVKELGEEGRTLAEFSQNAWEVEKLHCTFNSCEEAAVIAAIKEFITGCKAKIESDANTEV